MSRKVPHLVTKGHSFYFRIRVPVALVPSEGKTEITKALPDMTKAQAAVAAGELGAQYRAHFLREKHRLGLVDNPPAPPARASLPEREATADEVEALAKVAAREMLAQDEEVRIEGTDTVGAWLSILQQQEEEVTAALADGRMGDLKPRVLALLAKRGLTLPGNRAEVRRMLRAWASVQARAFKTVEARSRGEPVDTPPPVPLPASLDGTAAAPIGPDKKPAGVLTLRDVFELWKTDERSRPAKTIQKAELALRTFEDLTGNPALGVLNKAMGSDFRRALLAEEMSDKTASDRLGWVQILLNFEATRYGRIAANPWKGLTINVRKSAGREEWKDDEAIKLFALPLFQRYELPTDKNAGGPAAYWAPLIAAFTGARITEIAQLLLADIQHEGGQWFIRFEVTDPEWQSLKRDASWRTIPMHQELVRLGLPEYARTLHEAGESRLFPLLTVSQLNNAGGGLSKWFSSFKSAAGFGPATTFHGWRNTVETKLQRAREGQLFIDKYLGHKPKGGEGPETYARIRPGDLIDTAAKVAYDGLSLPKIYMLNS